MNMNTIDAIDPVINQLVKNALIKLQHDGQQAEAAKEKLWRISDIAEYMDVGTSTAYKIKDTPGFPRPIVVGGHPRWVPNEVKNWLSKQRG